MRGRLLLLGQQLLFAAQQQSELAVRTAEEEAQRLIAAQQSNAQEQLTKTQAEADAHIRAQQAKAITPQHVDLAVSRAVADAEQ